MKGSGNSYTTEFRQYDPRLGRWLTFDPLSDIQPSYSPYAFSNNNPIFGSDPDGDICIPCMLLNGLLDVGGQIIGLMGQGLSFSEAFSDISWWSVGWSVLQGSSPGGVGRQVKKIIKNPAIRPYIDDFINMAGDALSEWIDDGDFDVKKYLRTIIYGDVANKITKKIPKNKELAKQTKVLTRNLDRATRLNRGGLPKKSRIENEQKLRKKLNKVSEEKHFSDNLPSNTVKKSLEVSDQILTPKIDESLNEKPVFTWTDPVKIGEEIYEGTKYEIFEQTRSDGKVFTYKTGSFKF